MEGIVYREGRGANSSPQRKIGRRHAAVDEELRSGALQKDASEPLQWRTAVNGGGVPNPSRVGAARARNSARRSGAGGRRQERRDGRGGVARAYVGKVGGGRDGGVRSRAAATQEKVTKKPPTIITDVTHASE
jgi:hypothetical protein